MVNRLMAGTAAASSQSAAMSNCGPGGASAGPASLERMNYVPRMLLTAADLTAEQEYFRAKQRRHNRLLHGWGVVCGCRVTPAQPAPGQNTPPDWTVVVEPGYVLGPQGDEILVDEPISVDLSRQGMDGNAAMPCGDTLDPWCSNVRVDRRAGETIYIAVAYAECPTRPVRVQPAGCGCDGGGCEYSRIRDSFVVRALSELPAGYANFQPPGDPFPCPIDGVRECPPCVTEPWVILATVTFSGRTIRQQDIDNTTYRRYVAAFGDWWFTCGAPPPTPTPTPTPTPAPFVGLKVGAVRFISAQNQVVFEMQDPNDDIFLRAEDEVNAIEVRFVNASLNFSSVVSGRTFIVRDSRSGAVLPGRITNMPDNTVRWILAQGGAFGQGDFDATLVGDGSVTISSQQNRRLDGEPSQLPSGDNQEGGNFRFAFNIRFQ